MAENIVMEALLPVLLTLAAPFVGGILVGVDRKITARMQSRIGPPVLQPFYDVIKLWNKEPFITGSLQPVLAFSYLGFAVLAVGLFMLGGDLLLILFTSAIADVCLITASLNSKSPFSYLGGRRELLAVLSYEPVLILTFIGISMVTGSFLVEGVLGYSRPLLMLLPAVLVALEIVLLIELKKSPFDVSGSGHAHQELVRGVYTEFSGYTMAMLEVGHWVKMVLLLSIIALFWAPNLLVGTGLSLLLFFVALAVDNSYPRLTWKRMLGTAWGVGFVLILVNIVGLILMGVI